MQINKFFFIFLLVMAYALSFDVYLPSLPLLKIYFNSTQSEIQLTLSVFLITSAVSQLFAGFLFDKYGLATILRVSIVIFCISSLICVFATKLRYLIILRLFQGIGSAGLLITGLSLIQDYYKDYKSIKMYSYLNALVAVSPIIAPIIGAYINMYFGWRYIFAFLFLYGLLVSFFIYGVNKNEDIKLNKRKRDVSIQTYKNILKDKTYFNFLLSSALGSSIIFLFFSISPYLYVNIFKLSVNYFSFYFSISSLILLAGHYLTGKFLGKTSPYRLIYVAKLFLLISCFEIIISYNFKYTATILVFLILSNQILLSASILLSEASERQLIYIKIMPV